MKPTLFCISLLSMLAGAQLQAEEFIDEFTDGDLSAAFSLEDDIPVVLTAARLRQPRSEVPASVTVIDAQQIQAWGVRTLPEVLRYVPGMFIGHGDDQNNAAVAYHASSPSLMRRLQVLVDGRSVFRAGIASVVWDDIPVAMEDILRIEVTRGPNAAAYGANSFLGVINIITKHPGDTLGTRVRYRNGNQGVDDAFVSHAWNTGLNSYRLTFNLQASDGFDGSRESTDPGEDNFRDSKRHGFLTGYFSRQLDGGSQLNAQASFKQGHSDIRIDNEFFRTPPDQDVTEMNVLVRLQQDFSDRHQSHLQAYISRNDRRQENYACAPTVFFDPDLYSLYAQNPPATDYLLAGDTASLMTSLETPEQQQLVNNISGRFYADPANASETACGKLDQNILEKRFDIEWQDTVQWSDTFRTVSGLSVRRDQVTSETFFGGTRVNDTLRLFASTEWRPARFMLINVGAMYEDEDTNQSEVSPRVAVNWLLSPQQSIRMVYSEAVRSPDLVEQEPDYSLQLEEVTDNYLGQEALTFYMHQKTDHRGLTPERIASTEIGYYVKLADYRIEADVKVYQDRLSNLISSAINLATPEVRDDTRMNVNGAELQLQWHPTPNDRLWLVAAYIDTDVFLGDTSGLSQDEIARQLKTETRLSAQNSMVVSWQHSGNQWSLTGSHFWFDGYNKGDEIYRRLELNLRKEWQLNGMTPWVGGFWQYLISEDELNYKNQRYSDDNVYFLQLGLDF
ncbi:MAG: hypothetical protein CMI02_00355 [Oceanospirillaceae bacterium]|nr:hypothetical protein [Oceanospirillaceae bacterium]|tara:strand:- start:41188 stop:43389 length:2202 start_codon:yes stop_codon:yes gene_type:complete